MGQLTDQLLQLSAFLKALESQAHIIHLNYVGEGNFLSVHTFMKGQYEAHLKQLDQAAEFVRALGVKITPTVAGLHALPPGFQDLECDCGDEAMLGCYHGNLQRLIAMAQQLEPIAQQARAIDVVDYLAALVGASSLACFMVRATLGCP